MVISDTVHSDFLSYPFRSPVIRMDDSNQFDDVNVFSGVLATSSGCFRREPLAKKIGAHVVPDLRARRSSYQVGFGHLTELQSFSRLWRQHPMTRIPVCSYAR